eukprot:CAMPEP_0194080240 /NCGR_PEP_ID=MMETSP0149-20130528/6289_1 /TAXON_ID=122233 /ORGANISM="Chaetoceros debilis, Strain MM31A-1" /LENGTH=2026 /DNA_ID=CAMNT_0038761911 /DNA_START=189 /DNA_END=6269 /DNA_ORIENTATION=-
MTTTTTTTTARLTEVPIITQDHDASQRYIIQNDLSIVPSHKDYSSSNSNSKSSFWDGNDEEWQGRMQGCAATHVETNTKKGQSSSIIRTCALVEEPYVLSIAKVCGTGTGTGTGTTQSLSSIEVDLSQLDGPGNGSGGAFALGKIVKTFIFQVESLRVDNKSNGDDSMDMDEDMDMDIANGSAKRIKGFYKVLLVDSQANILTLGIQMSNDSSSSPIIVTAAHTSTSQILSNTDSNANIHPHHRYYNLTSSQITSLDSDGSRLVMAISPHILCLNVVKNTVTSWTNQSCLYNRRKSISGVLKSAGGLLMGRSVEDCEEEFVEEEGNGDGEGANSRGRGSGSSMASTAAICSFSILNDDDDDDSDDDDEDSNEGNRIRSATMVCSLHADGSVRLWTLTPKCRGMTYPKQVRFLHEVGAGSGAGAGSGSDGADGTMPLPHLWSSSHDSLHIEGYAAHNNHNHSSDYANNNSNCNAVNFVIAVSIRIAERMGMARTCSPCHLTTLTGVCSSSGAGDVKNVQTLRMDVPNAVDGMKAMEFVHGDTGTGTGTGRDNAWELRTLASCLPKSSEETSLYASLAAHAPLRKVMLLSYNSTQSPQPVVAIASNTLDDMAEGERERIMHECRVLARDGVLDDDEDEDEDEDINVGKMLRRVDGWYMKRIFRSTSVPTIGMSHASNGTIQRALRSVVPPLCFDDISNDNTSTSSERSIEMETAIVMKKWSQFEDHRAHSPTHASGRSNRGAFSPSPKRAKHDASTYRSFMQSVSVSAPSPSTTPEIHNEMNMDMNMNMDTGTDRTERRIQEQHDRWRKLLVAMGQEESKLHLPLSFVGTSGSGSNSVLVRAGITTTLVVNVNCESSRSDSKTALDAAVMTMLEDIENGNGNGNGNGANAELIVAFETRIHHMISGAKLIFDEERDMLLTFVREVLAGINSNGFDCEEHVKVISSIVSTMNGDDLRSWLSSPLSSSLILQPEVVGVGDGGGVNSVSADILLPSAARLSQQYLSACRRLTLARYFGIMTLESKGYELFSGPDLEAERMSLVTYLQTVATSWAYVEQVSVSEQDRRGSPARTRGSAQAPPSTAFSASNTSLSGVSSTIDNQPKMRSRGSSSNLQQHNRRTLLDVALREVYKVHANSRTNSNTMPMASAVVQSSKALMRHTFPLQGQVPDRGQEIEFPELYVLSTISIYETPRLSLRLLSPLVAFPPTSTSTSTSSRANKSRNYLVANNLLSEVNALAKSNAMDFDTKRSTELLDHASILLKKINGVRVLMADSESLSIFLKIMTDLPDNWSSNPNRSVSEEYMDGILTDALQAIFSAESSEVKVTKEDIKALVNMETVRSLFMPWIIASVNNNNHVNPVHMIAERIGSFTMDSMGNSSISEVEVMQHALHVFLMLSNLLQRVATIESHGSSMVHPKVKAPYAKMLIKAINDVIETIQLHARKEDYRHFQEYAAIWSSLFRHALQGKCWEDAFESCLSNPVKERRTKNFKRLVLAMVDAGALGALLNKMLFINIDCNGNDEDDQDNNDIGNASPSMDLYELASQTLADAAIQHVSSDIDSFCNRSSTSNVDYKGCLYALHAAYGDWRRSSQAIDFLSEDLALRRLASEQDNQTQNPNSMEEDSTHSDDMHIDGRVMNDLVLWATTSAQLIQLVDDVNQRYFVSGELSTVPFPELSDATGNAASELASTSAIEPLIDSADRVSRLFTEKTLQLRAKKLIALHTLQKDAYAPDSLLDILQSSDTAIIDALSRLGYYHHAISFAHCKKTNKDGGKIGGRDLFVDAISHMLHNCLAPVAVNLAHSPGSDVQSDIGIDGSIMSRPTINQLRLLVGDGRLSRPSETWQRLNTHMDVERGTAAMGLLRLYVERYAKEDKKVAIELAEKLLDLENAKLPIWLQDLVIGQRGADGLFANNGVGNPTALLNLFIRNGLYVDACQLVSEVILGDKNKDRDRAATSRLPELGNIDYVPYDVIDRLWNVIETHLRTSGGHSLLDQKLLNARQSVETALEKHFNLMQLSEMGMLSARALRGKNRI